MATERRFRSPHADPHAGSCENDAEACVVTGADDQGVTFVQPKSSVFTSPTVTDAQLTAVHMGLRKVATPAAPVVVWRVSGRLS